MKKKILSKGLRLQIRLMMRWCADLIKGNLFRFASSGRKSDTFVHKITIKQEIKKTDSTENKIENIRIASEKINKITIKPGQLFSFWNIVGKASAANGFRKSRNIVQGVLQEDYGGGLCQLAGIIYHSALLTDLDILERFNHSLDLYTEDSRYTPLGADAAVVYGYKDLRILNTYSFAISFAFEITNESLKVFLLSPENIHKKDVYFERESSNSRIKVVTRDGNEKLLAVSEYKKP
ncbi:hypothetical protein GCM10022393_12600 [Aquimarina addita]|uniref:Vancomycin resistance protein VanW n=1 Tax=Aquimarina addita TaxID=870485 RepID=A0ABP7XEB6_9FLAO